MDSEQGNNERSIEYSLAERLLLPAALLIGVLFDRLVVARFMHIGLLAPSAAAFWLCCLAVFIGFNLKRLSRGRAHWIVAGCAAALCVWNFLYDQNGEFKLLTLLVIPAVLMAYAQFVAGGMPLKEAGRLTKAWFAGWFPFSGL
ncbi:MAG: hypothetical protein LBR72_00865, partial [Oscillospiraceae bacterium]|nr:hypothetical protein [Oscillospiraceae bacterium]